MTFPATLLLKREEAETNKLSGVGKKDMAFGSEQEPTAIAAVHHDQGDRNRACKDAHFGVL